MERQPKKKIKLLESTTDNKHIRDGKQKPEYLLRLETKSASPKQMMERSDLQFSTIEPSSPCRNSQRHLKDKDRIALLHQHQSRK